MSKQWKAMTRGGPSTEGLEVRNIRHSENYGRHLLQGEILFKLQWTVGIWYPDGKYAGALVHPDNSSLDLMEVSP